MTKSKVPRNEVLLDLGDIVLFGDLDLPERPHGLVIFAHGSGSSRKSPRNQFVAHALNRAGFGTLLLDLLTERESLDHTKVFDINLLAQRLRLTTNWTKEHSQIARLPIGYFGASTGAAAALMAAAAFPEVVHAVVSRGGRPDLALESLHHVQSPTLLIVGGADREVLDLNRFALGKLECETAIVTVPGATHLFEEPGALEEVARLAIGWFDRFLVTGGAEKSLPPFGEPPAPTL